MKQTPNLINICKLMAGLLMLAGGSLLTPVQAEDVYKWVNEHNETQYTQMPPPHGIKAIRIQSAAPQRSSYEQSASAAPQQAAGNPVSDAAADTEQGSTGDPADRDAEIARSMQENCTNAHKNLKSLQQGGQVRYINPEGEVIRLTEEERQQRIEEANSQIKLLCKN